MGILARRSLQYLPSLEKVQEFLRSHSMERHFGFELWGPRTDICVDLYALVPAIQDHSDNRFPKLNTRVITPIWVSEVNMTSSEKSIEQRIHDAVFRSLRLPASNLPLRMGSTPGWDSLGHMDVVLELEREFNIRFAAHQLAQLTDVAAIANTVRNSTT